MYNSHVTLLFRRKYTLPSTTILLKIGILVVSFIIGIGFFYVTNQADKQTKKQQIDKFLSYTINFILFIWAAKIIVHISIFIEDPFAVLAYPSDSKSVYIASVFIVAQIIYHKYRKDLKVNELVTTLIPVFLATSFLYEFLQLIKVGGNHTLPNFLVVTVLLLLYIGLQDKWLHERLASLIVVLYSVAHIVFNIVFGYTVVYEYMLHPLYFIIIIIGTLVLLLKKRITN